MMLCVDCVQQYCEPSTSDAANPTTPTHTGVSAMGTPVERFADSPVPPRSMYFKTRSFCSSVDEPPDAPQVLSTRSLHKRTWGRGSVSWGGVDVCAGYLCALCELSFPALLVVMYVCRCT